eukprot:CAMPEP_0170438656 /NCGR_PEP_ID=MMETSP0117_2-20130122/45358_1 /TAXON_ID=400756 /ORGANISM="Durinskia baltica, Strain CSIRO CS-38" /LENGTH=55 /DNA_ID=CAMNT_0010698907 /DNA_START=123 /DNA_END=286 /DNA_ORIENTATION=-
MPPSVPQAASTPKPVKVSQQGKLLPSAVVADVLAGLAPSAPGASPTASPDSKDRG